MVRVLRIDEILLWLKHLRLKKSRDQLTGSYAHYNRWDSSKFGASMLMPKKFQPYLAVVGFSGCFVMMFVFTTSLFWVGDPRPQVVAFMAVPVLLVLLWLLLKLLKYFRGYEKSWYEGETRQDGFWWVSLDETRFLKTIDRIIYLKDSQGASDGINMHAIRN